MAINDYLKRVFPGSADEYAKLAESAMLRGERMFIVTANPEIIMAGGRDPQVDKLLMDPKTNVVPDGISVVKAMNIIGLTAKERITGVDLAGRLLNAAGKAGKSVFLLGAKEEVVSALAQKLRAQYPQLTVNYRNGYYPDKDAIFG